VKKILITELKKKNKLLIAALRWLLLICISVYGNSKLQVKGFVQIPHQAPRVFEGEKL
jgi:hypothetical protein